MFLFSGVADHSSSWSVLGLLVYTDFADSAEVANDDAGVRTSLLSAMLCCNTTLEQVTDEEAGETKWEPRGNSSEAPIVVAGMKVGFTTESVAKDYGVVAGVASFAKNSRH